MDSLPQTPQDEVVVVLLMCSEGANEAPSERWISIASDDSSTLSTSDIVSMIPSESSRPSTRFSSCPGVRIVRPRECGSESGAWTEMERAASTETASGSRVVFPPITLETGLCSMPSMSRVVHPAYWVMADAAKNLQPFKYHRLKGMV